ncbi:accessory Sec system glycosylation chaperone GtfB [Staphylococcus epidermidis]|uniref:accessory Sec system glycosylation chaperone GtfB n=1 Tax=Staphylococcus epidermidis TaxID=1282 RepID=UPI0011A234CD|nr:accessory Sec system glycosylation chaperone GtfB [Staphylococcus epidermidis]MEB6268372.1 accessory Sec system glycosylation chaperone GtfB [Staphylococcus epidermidis]
MINLYDNLNSQTLQLYQSFLIANINATTVVVDDNGFLPSDVLSPYKFFSKNSIENEKPLYFNDVPVPKYWEIVGSNLSAVIKDKDKIRGKIVYQKGYRNRIVSSVEWLNKSGNVQFIDYYNQHGFRFAQLVMDDYQNKIIKRYFDQNNDEFLVENFVTKDLILKWDKKDIFFDNRISFLSFFFEKANLSIKDIVLNSFATSFLFLYRERHFNSKCRIFWQEKIKDELPENMKIALKNIENLKILIPDRKEYNRVLNFVETSYQHKIENIGYVYEFLKVNKYKNEVLILTNSDDIPHIDVIALENQNITFHIASKTEMSSKLLQLGKIQNVNLYPKSNEENILSLCRKCDIYLDINKGKEIFESVRLAFAHEMLIFAYEETIHNRQFVHSSNIYKLDSYYHLSNAINQINNDKTLFYDRLNKQLRFANSVSIESFQNKIK